MERRANRPAALFSGIRLRERAVFAPSPSFVTKRVSCVGSTVTAADDLQRRHRPIEALGSAFAASLLVHLALLAFLVLAGWGPGVGRALWSSVSDGPLEVVLATTRPPADKANAGAAVEVTRAGTAPAADDARICTSPPPDPGETGSPRARTRATRHRRRSRSTRALRRSARGRRARRFSRGSRIPRSGCPASSKCPTRERRSKRAAKEPCSRGRSSIGKASSKKRSIVSGQGDFNEPWSRDACQDAADSGA